MLLAVLALLLQTATVSAHGLMPVPRADGEAIALCTPYGVKIVYVDADGVPVAPKAHGGDDCTLCLHAAGGAALPPPPAIPPVVVVLTATAMPTATPPLSATPYRAQSPRGPPAHG